MRINPELFTCPSKSLIKGTCVDGFDHYSWVETGQALDVFGDPVDRFSDLLHLYCENAEFVKKYLMSNEQHWFKYWAFKKADSRFSNGQEGEYMWFQLFIPFAESHVLEVNLSREEGEEFDDDGITTLPLSGWYIESEELWDGIRIYAGMDGRGISAHGFASSDLNKLDQIEPGTYNLFHESIKGPDTWRVWHHKDDAAWQLSCIMLSDEYQKNYEKVPEKIRDTTQKRQSDRSPGVPTN